MARKKSSRNSKKTEAYYRRRIAGDTLVMFGGVLLMLLLVRSGLFDQFLTSFQGAPLLAAFIAGIFFTSGLTLLPASIALAHISSQLPVVPFLVIATLGAVSGDLFLFRFVRDVFAEDLMGAIKHSHLAHYLRRPKAGIMRILTPILGGVIVASPLPDELGLLLMGLSRASLSMVVPILVVMNAMSVAAVASIGSLFR